MCVFVCVCVCVCARARARALFLACGSTSRQHSAAEAPPAAPPRLSPSRQRERERSESKARRGGLSRGASRSPGAANMRARESAEARFGKQARACRSLLCVLRVRSGPGVCVGGGGGLVRLARKTRRHVGREVVVGVRENERVTW